MPWFLNPSEYARLPLYQNPELYLFLAKLAATALFAWTLWRRDVRGRRLFAGTWGFFAGLFVVVMLSMHALVITGLRMFGRPEGAPFGYDFHYYSLMLLAAVLVPQGLRCLRRAGGVGKGDAVAYGDSIRSSLVVLAVAVPLIPLQFFGLVLTALFALNLAALALARRGAAVRAAAPPARVPTVADALASL